MRLLVAFWLLMVSVASFAAGPDMIIAPPAGFPRSGQMTEFSLYLHNSGSEVLSLQLPARLSCRIKSDNRTVEVSATAIEPQPATPASLRAGGFLKARYEFIVPEGLTGIVLLDVSEFDTSGVLFRIAAGPPPKPIPLADDSDPSRGDATLDSLSTLYQPYILNFATYEPMYFLAGTDPQKSKFQISFKYRILNPRGGLVEEHPWLSGLHLGYTQTSFWDLKSDSAPFKDTSYKPELFFVSPNAKLRPSWMKGLFAQAGFRHESNGRDGWESRSTNFLYAKPIFIFYDPGSRYGMAVAPTMWAYVNNDEKTNSDLRDYRGYFELELKLGKQDAFMLDSYFRWANAGASVQLDLTYPIRSLLFSNIDLFFHAQYVNSLAESLLNFRERSEAVRLGFSIVR